MRDVYDPLTGAQLRHRPHTVKKQAPLGEEYDRSGTVYARVASGELQQASLPVDPEAFAIRQDGQHGDASIVIVGAKTYFPL
jgi:hypothetical protein